MLDEAISARTFSASRNASERRGKISEDSATIRTLRWTRRHRQPRSSSLNTSNRHIPEHIDRHNKQREIDRGTQPVKGMCMGDQEHDPTVLAATDMAPQESLNSYRPTEAGKPCTFRSRTLIQTVRLDSRDIKPSWPLAIASLEQLSGWTVLALRLGTLALIQQCVRELAERDAPAALVVSLRELVEALAHMPLES